MNQPLTFSIIIPVYNEQGYLDHCLRSLALQTVKPDEVIVIDNNSTDDTAAIAASFDFVTLLREPRQGRIYAQDTGVRNAKGKIIVRLDGDTRLPPEWMARAKEYFTTHPTVDAVTGKGSFYDVHHLGNVVSVLHGFFYFSVQRFLTGTYILWGSNMAIKKEVYESMQRPDSAMVHEDIDLSLKLKKADKIIALVPELKAEMSMRHGRYKPKETLLYLAGAPQTDFKNGFYLAGVLYGLILGIVYVSLLPVMLVLSIGSSLFGA